MTLHFKSILRGELRLEATVETLKCYRRTFSGGHQFEAPLTEVSLTLERVKSVATGSYFWAALCLILAGFQVYSLITEPFHLWNWIFFGALLAFGGYSAVAARMNSGDFIVVRSTKEASRDIWIRRNGHEDEVDRFVEHLRQQIAHGRK